MSGAFSMFDEREWEEKRQALVKNLVREGYLRSKEVIAAVSKVRRHRFVPLFQRMASYEDHPLPIGNDQTISAPHMVSIMAEKLDLKKGQTVLEVGGGSGYHAAVIAEVVGKRGHVFTLEIIPELAERAAKVLEEEGYGDTVTGMTGDGPQGLPEHAPYDRIFVACAAPDVPPPLVQQLKDGGRMLVPVDTGMGYQDLMLVTRVGGKVTVKSEGGCVFVPLRGKFGF